MADTVALRYRNRNVVFTKSKSLVAVRARAGMASTMQIDVDSVATANGAKPIQIVGAFDVIELRPSASGLEQDLDWLRGRPSVALATHVFHIKGSAELMVPNGDVLLQFDTMTSGHEQEAMMTRYRLQAVEDHGNGEYLVRITSGSRNPLATAAALQAEPGVSLAEPEFAAAGQPQT